MLKCDCRSLHCGLRLCRKRAMPSVRMRILRLIESCQQYLYYQHYQHYQHYQQYLYYQHYQHYLHYQQYWYITRNTYITSNTYIPSVFVTPPTTCHASAEPSASSDKGSSTQGVLLPNFLIFNLLSSHHRLVLSVLLKHACQITFPITNPRL